MTIQPTDAFKQVRVPQPSHAQPGGSSWRNRFAASPVSHGLRHLASVGKSPPRRLTPSRSRGGACAGIATSTPPGLHSRHAQAASPPYGRATLAGRPAVHARMINLDSALCHHLLEVSQAQRIGHVPPHAQRYHVPVGSAAVSRPWRSPQAASFDRSSFLSAFPPFVSKFSSA